jgi:hypothetical protein
MMSSKGRQKRLVLIEAFSLDFDLAGFRETTNDISHDFLVKF